MSLLPRKFYFDNIFDDLLMDAPTDNMKCDIYEKDGKYHIELEVPGYTKDDIKVECHEGYLTITAEKERTNKEDGKNYIKRERTYGCTTRQFYVGDIDLDDVEAEFNDGILKVVVPKEEKEITKKQIIIK